MTPPNIIEIGGVHCAPGKPLPQNLQQIIESSSQVDKDKDKERDKDKDKGYDKGTVHLENCCLKICNKSWTLPQRLTNTKTKRDYVTDRDLVNIQLIFSARGLSWFLLVPQ